MPRFVGVAGAFLLALRVAHEPAVLPRVLRHPGARRCFLPPAGQARFADRDEVDRHAELVLGMAGARRERHGLLEAVAVAVIREYRDLFLIAPIGAPGSERRA